MVGNGWTKADLLHHGGGLIVIPFTTNITRPTFSTWVSILDPKLDRVAREVGSTATTGRGGRGGGAATRDPRLASRRRDSSLRSSSERARLYGDGRDFVFTAGARVSDEGELRRVVEPISNDFRVGIRFTFVAHPHLRS